MAKTNNRILIIPDAHVHPDYDNDRFRWIGNLIEVERPNTIVCIGDWADMPSLCSYDKGRAKFAGREYAKDVAAANDAQDKLLAGFRRVRRYNPRMVMCLGNHEERINTACDMQSELKNTIKMSDLGYEKHGWEVHRFKDVIVIQGWHFSHYFTTGISARPIGGENPGAMLINKMHQSCVAGHSHLVSFAERTNACGGKIHGLVVGCWTHPDYREDWCYNTTPLWRRCITILDEPHNGDYEQLRIMNYEHVRRHFS